MQLYVYSFAAAILINAAFFAYAAAKKTDVVTDLSYSLSFALVAATLIAVRAEAGWLGLLPAALTIVWAVRLGAYLFGRIIKIKVDHRFDDKRGDPWKFASVWSLQAVAVGVILLPVTASAAAPGPRGFGAVEAVALALWLAGFLIEAVADAQKSAFKAAGRPGFIRGGLWAYSRHPNYFGEALLWWALWLYGLGAWSLAVAVLAVLGPLSITALLLFVSGIPLLEKSADAKYGADPDYVEYKRRTSLFLLWPPKRPQA
jgi:steroid 5-alpha reductase family enzyme